MDTQDALSGLKPNSKDDRMSDSLPVGELNITQFAESGVEQNINDREMTAPPIGTTYSCTLILEIMFQRR